MSQDGARTLVSSVRVPSTTFETTLSPCTDRNCVATIPRVSGQRHLTPYLTVGAAGIGRF